RPGRVWFPAELLSPPAWILTTPVAHGVSPASGRQQAFFHLLVLGLLLLLGTASPVPSQAASDAEGKVRIKRSSAGPIEWALAKGVTAPSPDCGANSLYVFLRLHGVNSSLKQIKQEVPLNEQGASMLDLREAASRAGVDALVIQAAPVGLADKLPSI